VQEQVVACNGQGTNHEQQDRSELKPPLHPALKQRSPKVAQTLVDKNTSDKGTAVLPCWWLRVTPHETLRLEFHDDDSKSATPLQLSAYLIIPQNQEADTRPVSPLTEDEEEDSIQTDEEDDSRDSRISTRRKTPTSTQSLPPRLLRHPNNTPNGMLDTDIVMDYSERTSCSCPQPKQNQPANKPSAFHNLYDGHPQRQQRNKRLQSARPYPLLFREGNLVQPPRPGKKTTGGNDWNATEWGVYPWHRDYEHYQNGTRLPPLYQQAILLYAQYIGMILLESEQEKTHRFDEQSTQDQESWVQTILDQFNQMGEC